jgi:hypothetical protein
VQPGEIDVIERNGEAVVRVAAQLARAITHRARPCRRRLLPVGR